MKKRGYGIIAGLLAAAMVAGTFASCQSAPADVQSAPADAPSAQGGESQAPAEPISFPLAEPAELTIATEDGTVASLADNLPLWQEIEKRTNIKIS